MADLSREHNTAAAPEMARHHDPALDVANQHGREHLHHSSHAHADQHDNKVYVHGTEPVMVPNLGPNDHLQATIIPSDHAHAADRKEMEIEKKAAYYDAEQGSTEKDSNVNGVAEGEHHRKMMIKAHYRKYRWILHLFFGCLFTGYAMLWLLGNPYKY